MKTFAREHKIVHFFDVGRGGIEHVVPPEEGLVAPGDLIVGGDSHSCTYGAFGAFFNGTNWPRNSTLTLGTLARGGVTGQSNSLERAVPNFILSRNFEPAFAMDGISKDLECGAQTAKELGVRRLLLSIAQQCYIEARGLGFGLQDVASVIRPMGRLRRSR